MNFRHVLVLVPLLLWCAEPAETQQPRISRIDPPFWWTGMRQDTLELLVTGGPFTNTTVTTSSSGIRLLSSEVGGRNSYLFVTLRILPDATAGEHTISIAAPTGTISCPYALRRRDTLQPGHGGFGPQDAVYLITPDRFANGDTTNDNIAGMREHANRADPYGRHGGDIQGIINHLPYLKDLGVTALWINPLTENDNPFASYHGYAATNLFRIDPRFGSDSLYCTLVREAHRIGLKVLLDHVSNHLSVYHPWVEDPPMADWFNGSREEHLHAFHHLARLNDPHATPGERTRVVKSWFSGGMPDLNQANPHLRRYLIQNTIWWMELSGIDGIREDTYPYCDGEYSNAWCRAILREYPQSNIVGEVWMNEPPSTASFQRGNRMVPHRQSALPTVTDFPLYEALKAVFARKASIGVLAECFSMDFCYAAPDSLLTFADNHDVPRLAFMTGNDVRRRTMALTILLTARGIPQIYYGTEFGLQGGKDDGAIRADMPGGFPADTRDAFTAERRTPEEQSWFNYVRDLLHLRQRSSALQDGRFVHFTPLEEVYIYFRISEGSTIMVAVNNNDAAKTIFCSRFRECLPEGTTLQQLTGEGRGTAVSADLLKLEPLSATVYEVLR
jgi:glycosidase